jgi:curli production assembly/transport component CsgG
MLYAWSKSACAVALMVGLSGCISGGLNDPLAEQASMIPDTKTGVVLANLPSPAQPLDVSVYSFPDLTGQNKDNDNFAEFSRAVTQGGAAILTDVLTKAGGGEWFNVVERNELTALLQERQIIQNTRVALYGKKAESLPALRFAGVMLQGGIIGYDTNETSGGVGANWLGIGGNIQYRRDVVTVALRAVSVQTGRVLASVTTTETVYSVLVQGSAFRYQAVNELLQAEAGITKNSPVTLAVREGIQLAVYALIFEGVKHDLWKFKDSTAGASFMRDLDLTGKAVNEAPISPAPNSVPPSPTASLATPQTSAAVAQPPIIAQPAAAATVAITPAPSIATQQRNDAAPSAIPTPPERPAVLPQTARAGGEVSFDR